MKINYRVHYLSDSGYKFEELKEYKYLSSIISILLFKTSKQHFFIYSSHNGVLDALMKKIENEKVRVNNRVLIYVSDETSSLPVELSKHFKYIFKNYLDRNSYKNIYSFPLGCVADIFPRKEIRSTNVFFTGNLNQNRIELAKAVFGVSKIHDKLFYFWWYIISKIYKSDLIYSTNKSYIRFNRAFDTGLDHKDYGKMLSNSNIAICPYGFVNKETFRFFEAMKAGCAIVSLPMPDTYYYRDCPAVIVNNWEEGIGEINKLLNDPMKMAKIQENSFEWYEKYCDEKSVAKYILKIIS